MGGALFAILSFFIMGTISIQYKIDIEKNQHNIISKRGYKNGVNFENGSKHLYEYQQTNQMNTIGSDSKEEYTTNPIEQIEQIETVALRTCRRLNVYAKQLGCINAESELLVWGFLGAKGTKGSLEKAWKSGATTTAPTCTTLDAFGRHLIRRAIPLNKIINQKGTYMYNLTGMQGNFLVSTDPCGYREFIEWKEK